MRGLHAPRRQWIVCPGPLRDNWMFTQGGPMSARRFLILAMVAAMPVVSSVRGSAWQQPSARHENGYVKVGDRFYLVGGRNDRPVDIFDPAKGTWSKGATP